MLGFLFGSEPRTFHDKDASAYDKRNPLSTYDCNDFEETPVSITSLNRGDAFVIAVVESLDQVDISDHFPHCNNLGEYEPMIVANKRWFTVDVKKYSFVSDQYHDDEYGKHQLVFKYVGDKKIPKGVI